MNESFERSKSPEHILYENVVRDNKAFVEELDAAQSLDELRDIMTEQIRVDGARDYLIFAVGAADGENIDIQPHLAEDLLKVIDIFKNDPPIDDLGVDEWMPHPDIARAIKRILLIQ